MSDEFMRQKRKEILRVSAEAHVRLLQQENASLQAENERLKRESESQRRLLAEATKAVSLEEVLADVVAWGKVTFPKGTDYGIITHMSRELRELVENPADGEEMADILILLAHLAAYHGVDLKGEVIAKMTVNRNRQWGEPDEAGVIEHQRTSGATSGGQG